MTKEDRGNMLDKAEALMREACCLVIEAGRGTSFKQISENIVSVMEEIISSHTEDSISILRKNILHADDGLSWTHPLVSVKDADRRDI